MTLSLTASETRALTLDDLKSIGPGTHPRYSPNLYKWLRKRGGFLRLIQVYQFNDEDLGQRLYIGFKDDGWFNGCLLMQTLCFGTKAHLNAYSGRGFEMVPDFWDRYMAIGRCAVDPEHSRRFTGDETRWQVDGDTRHCLWCGECTQVLRRWTEEVHHSAWEMKL